MRAVAAAGIVLGLLVAPLAGIAAASAEDGDGSDLTVTIPDAASGGGHAGEGEIANAELRWGVSDEANSGAFAGGCNFLSAGVAGDAGGAREWTAADGFYASESGNVSIVKATSTGGWAPATWETKCLDRDGVPVSSTSLTSRSESQVIVSGGVGEASAEGVEIQWTGSFTVAFYGGMSYWSASDPRLVMDADGDGVVTADLSGFASSRDDMSKWAPISADDVVIAEIRGAELSSGGFAEVPVYVGVEAAIDGQAAKTLDNAEYWGAFPATFLQFQERLGQAGYWMTTNGQRDSVKPPTTLYVSYDAAVPVSSDPPAQSPAQGTGQVLQPSLGARTTTAAPAAPTAAAPVTTTTAAAAAAPTAATASLVRTDGTGLIPDAGDWFSRFSLPGLVAMLAGLVAALAAMHLAGIPILPWMRPHPRLVR
ncbi:hypothetical protein [Microbacterium gilvum]|uniref:Htaa domain-containing protein n=1 Tax=Microbacterium gilvum TaxID=1336204 RepID=A0ABP9A090_9MICO